MKRMIFSSQFLVSWRAVFKYVSLWLVGWPKKIDSPIELSHLDPEGTYKDRDASSNTGVCGSQSSGH